MRVIDVSAYQPVIDWRRAKAAGVSAAYIKATEGTAYTAETLRAHHDGAKAAGVPFGVYHFLRFGQDPGAQALHFLNATAGLHGQLLPMVDVERGGQDGVTDLARLTATLSRFLLQVESTLAGKRALIYTGYGDWSDPSFFRGTDAFSGHPLWIAEYNHQATPTLPPGWKSWDLWQYTSGAVYDGIPGFVDSSMVNGDDLAPLYRF